MTKYTPKDRHYAQLRRNFRDKKIEQTAFKAFDNELFLYGYHPVLAALKNPKRKYHKLFATKNAFQKLTSMIPLEKIPIEIIDIKAMNTLIGGDAVHQGLVLKVEALKPKTLDQLKEAQLVLLLDQITDPHNVGAIMRSATAFNVDAIISVSRHSAKETAVLAKSASGALDSIDHIIVRNLADTLITLQNLGFQTIGLDSEAPRLLEEALHNRKIALVVGAEGKGLRQKIRQTVENMARLDVPGSIISLNVSNATAIALYATHKFLK